MATPPVPNIYLVGGSSPSSVTIEENTTGFCSVDGTVDNNNAGFSGTGFANTNNAANSGVTWRVSAAAAGNYTVTWRFSNGGGADRPGRVLVNSSTVLSSVSFPATTNWTTWTTASATVALPAGASDIRLEATGSTGLGNIDNISIQGNVTAATCTAARLATTGATAANSIAVTPNPSTDLFIINAAGDFRYTIYDQLGRVVEKGSGQNKVRVGQKLLRGIYTIQIEKDQRLQALKIVKQ